MEDLIPASTYSWYSEPPHGIAYGNTLPDAEIPDAEIWCPSEFSRYFLPRTEFFEELSLLEEGVGQPVEVQEPRHLLHRNEKRFRRGLVFTAHGWLYHSTLGSRVMKEKKNPTTYRGALLYSAASSIG